jgi:hypothetical protein
MKTDSNTSETHSLLVGFFLLATVALSSCGNSGNKKTRTDAIKDTHTTTTTQTTSYKKETAGSGTREEILRQSEITGLPASLAAFVPDGYTAIDTTGGDLNKDQYRDMIMVLKKNGEESPADDVGGAPKRPLLVLTGQPDGGYKQAAKNENVVLAIDMGGMMGDPFQGIAVKNGFFTVEHYGGSAWRWETQTTFRYSVADDTWLLHKEWRHSFHAASEDDADDKEHSKTVKDFGKVRFEDYDVYKEEE